MVLFVFFGGAFDDFNTFALHEFSGIELEHFQLSVLPGGTNALELRYVWEFFGNHVLNVVDIAQKDMRNIRSSQQFLEQINCKITLVLL